MLRLQYVCGLNTPVQHVHIRHIERAHTCAASCAACKLGRERCARGRQMGSAGWQRSGTALPPIGIGYRAKQRIDHMTGNAHLAATRELVGTAVRFACIMGGV